MVGLIRDLNGLVRFKVVSCLLIFEMTVDRASGSGADIVVDSQADMIGG